MKTKYIWLLAGLIGLSACDKDDVSSSTNTVLPELNKGSVDFSKYVSVGASFTAGYSDGALFKAAQEKSFPKLLSDKFALVGGGVFTQPLTSDNTGGLLVGGVPSAEYRLIFNGETPERLNDFLSGKGFPVPPITTEATTNLMSQFTNMGVPGAKSFHITFPGYASLNPYYGRMATSATATMVGDAMLQSPTFFTLSEIGGNDVLSYATSGGVGTDQTGNTNATSYGTNDITDPTLFNTVIDGVLKTMTTNGSGAKGVVANVPYVSSLPYFTTVPYNSLDPIKEPTLAAQVVALNTQIYGPLKQLFTGLGEPNRIDLLSATKANPLLIIDETATDRSAEITAAFTPSLGAPTAGAFGAVFGKARQATKDDLIVLPALGVIAKPVSGAPAQININGVSYPMQDQWVLTPAEQLAVKTATDAYNVSIKAAADTYNVAMVDFNGILQTASVSGVASGDYILTTDLVLGGLVSLDGVHLTTRGYSVLANEILKAIDTKYGSNFEASGNFYDPANFVANYTPTLQ